MREAARAGLVLRRDTNYAFLHDRVQEAAYSLIGIEQRVANHLRIGRCLAAAMSGENAHAASLRRPFNQFNHGITLISDSDEIDLVADLNRRAGNKARPRTAYASACRYFAAGTALLGLSRAGTTATIWPSSWRSDSPIVRIFQAGSIKPKSW